MKNKRKNHTDTDTIIQLLNGFPFRMPVILILISKDFRSSQDGRNCLLWLNNV